MQLPVLKASLLFRSLNDYTSRNQELKTERSEVPSAHLWVSMVMKTARLLFYKSRKGWVVCRLHNIFGDRWWRNFRSGWFYFTRQRYRPSIKFHEKKVHIPLDSCRMALRPRICDTKFGINIKKYISKDTAVVIWMLEGMGYCTGRKNLKCGMHSVQHHCISSLAYWDRIQYANVEKRLPIL